MSGIARQVLDRNNFASRNSQKFLFWKKNTENFAIRVFSISLHGKNLHRTQMLTMCATVASMIRYGWFDFTDVGAPGEGSLGSLGKLGPCKGRHYHWYSSASPEKSSWISPGDFLYPHRAIHAAWAPPHPGFVVARPEGLPSCPALGSAAFNALPAHRCRRLSAPFSTRVSAL